MRRHAGRGFRIAGAALFAAWLLCALFADHVDRCDPNGLHPGQRLEPPSAAYPLGTDGLGRCVLARVLHGARVSLLLTAAVLLCQGTIAVAAGTVAGYLGGIVDLAYLGLTDLLVALPEALVVLVAAALPGPPIPRIVGVLALFGWVNLSRVVRSVTLREREQPYVLAAISLGASRAYLLGRTLLPAVWQSVSVLLPLRASRVLLAIAGVGFLGLGVPPPTPEWGNMIGEGRHYARAAPWLVLGPGAAIVLAIAAMSLLAHGMKLRLSAPRTEHAR